MNSYSKLKDVFISHSMRDKETYIDNLVAELTLNGITCWYDTFEIIPGDNLIKKINHGLTHSKAIVLCISENFLNGNMAVEELETAISLYIQDKNINRIIPLFIGEAKELIKDYPMPLAKTAYIKWSSDLKVTVEQIKKVVLHINDLGSKYWYNLAMEGYESKNYTDAMLYGRRTLELDSMHYQALILIIASLLKQDRYQEAYMTIHNYDEKWFDLDDYSAPLDMVEFAQSTISSRVVGDEIDETGFSFNIVNFLKFSENPEAWKHLIKIYPKKKFSFHRKSMVIEIGDLGRLQTLEWFEDIVKIEKDEEVKESIIDILTIFLHKLPQTKDRIIQILEPYLEDEHEDVRSHVLIPVYFFHEKGSKITLDALLYDRAPIVRTQAFSLLSGTYNMFITDKWTVEESYENRDPDPLLTEKVIKEILNDFDEDVFEEIMDCINDGHLKVPKNFNIDKIKRPISEEVREATVIHIGNKKANKKNLKRILSYAKFDPSEFVREEAVSVLMEYKMAIKDKDLIELYEYETLHDVKEKISSLIIEKGGDKIDKIYIDILEKRLNSRWDGESQVRKIFSFNNESLIRSCVDICIQNLRHDLLILYIPTILEYELDNEAFLIVDFCLKNGISMERTVLACGLVKTISLDRFQSFENHENLNLRINVWRALENRLGNGEYLSKAIEFYKTILPKLDETDNEFHWPILYITDMVLEFGDRSEAISMLKDYYYASTKEKEGSFPIRAAWERLKILGESIPHRKFSTDKISRRPYDWPTINGPYFKLLQ